MANWKNPRRGPAIRHALTLVRKNLKRNTPPDFRDRLQMYGAEQALLWVLGEGAHPASLVRGWRRP